jgi:hypothetical protein
MVKDVIEVLQEIIFTNRTFRRAFWILKVSDLTRVCNIRQRRLLMKFSEPSATQRTVQWKNALLPSADKLAELDVF